MHVVLDIRLERCWFGVAGLILEVGGYAGEKAVQSASALFSIEICFVWIPIVVYILGLIIMKFYHLDREFDGIIADLKKRAEK